MDLIRSILFTVVFYVGSIPLVIWAFLTLLGNERAVLRSSRLWARWHRWCAAHILGIRTVIEGTLPQSGALVVFKHESMFETIEVLVMFKQPAVVFKKQLLAIPVWGLVARRHGVIPIDRDAGAAAMRQMIAAGKAALAKGRPIILFPEGTRVARGSAPELGAGMAGLYRLLGVPLVPVALDSGKVWPRGFIRHPGTVTMKVGEPIPPGLARVEVERRVHAAINALN